MTTDPRRLTDAAPLSAAELDQILRDNIHTRNGIAWIKNENLDGVVASYRLLAEQLAEAETIGQKNIQRADAYWVELNDFRTHLAEATAERENLRQGWKADYEAVAAMRGALEKIRTLTGHGCYDCMMAEPNRCPRCAEIDDTVDAALASPDRGASAVLAAALARVEANERLREALLDDSEERPTSKYRAATAASIAAERQEDEAVRTWRARRSGGTDG